MTCPSEETPELRLKLSAVWPSPVARLRSSAGGLALAESQEPDREAVVARIVRWLEASGLEVTKAQRKGRRLNLVASGRWESG